MCKIPVIKIEKIKEDDKQVGIQYRDRVIDLSEYSNEQKLAMFIDAVDALITSESSIILYRQDVRRLADKLPGESPRETFRFIKAILRSKYTVLKLSYNPRTQEFCGAKTAFILHWNR